MIVTIKNILEEIRPHQWIKNLTLFIFLIFSQEFFILHQFLVVLYATIAFTFLTSAVYIFNDLIDYKIDQKHPEKRNRPIASGKLNRNTAALFAVIFMLVSFYLDIHISNSLFVLSLLYLIIMICYSLFLKKIVILDALTIAVGFVIRVLIGAFVIAVPNLFSWVIIVTINIALLLAFGKRQSEITLLAEKAGDQRAVLKEYPNEFLNTLISALVASTFLSYILLTFQTDVKNAGAFFTPNINFPHIPDTLLRSTHLLKFTIPIVFFGIARYIYVIYTKKDGKSPEQVLYSDFPLLCSIVIWAIVLFLFLYVDKLQILF